MADPTALELFQAAHRLPSGAPEALRLYTQSANMDYPPALFEAGDAITNNARTRDEFRRGYAYLSRAADHGDPRALLKIADYNDHGGAFEIVPDKDHADELRRRATEQRRIIPEGREAEYYEAQFRVAHPDPVPEPEPIAHPEPLRPEGTTPDLHTVRPAGRLETLPVIGRFFQSKADRAEALVKTRVRTAQNLNRQHDSTGSGTLDGGGSGGSAGGGGTPPVPNGEGGSWGPRRVLTSGPVKFAGKSLLWGAVGASVIDYGDRKWHGQGWFGSAGSVVHDGYDLVTGDWSGLGDRLTDSRVSMISEAEFRKNLRADVVKHGHAEFTEGDTTFSIKKKGGTFTLTTNDNSIDFGTGDLDHTVGMASYLHYMGDPDNHDEYANILGALANAHPATDNERINFGNYMDSIRNGIEGKSPTLPPRPADTNKTNYQFILGSAETQPTGSKLASNSPTNGRGSLRLANAEISPTNSGKSDKPSLGVRPTFS